jgi:hypothetical protein
MDASFAIDYAIASVERANRAVLDAIDGYDVMPVAGSCLNCDTSAGLLKSPIMFNERRHSSRSRARPISARSRPGFTAALDE